MHSTKVEHFPFLHRLAGLVGKASASGAEDPGFESRLRRDFSGSSHTSDLKIGTQVATLECAWRYRVDRLSWPWFSVHREKWVKRKNENTAKHWNKNKDHNKEEEK